MAKQKISTDLIMCDGFWQPENPGDTIKGVLLTMNMVEDKLAKKDANGKALRPLYVIALVEDAPKMVFMNKEAVTLKKGQVVGVNSSYKIDVAMRKLGGVARVCGHEIEIVYKGKETNKKNNLPFKTYDFTWDTDLNAEFKDRVVMPDVFTVSRAAEANQEEIPF